MKVCSNTTCKRRHDTKWKTCPHCLQVHRRSFAKRNRKATQKKVAEGFQMCIGCFKIKPNACFKSKFHRRKKITQHCQWCRDIHKKTRCNPSTKLGKCRAFWGKWKKEQSCIDCGLQDFRVIEADHVKGSKIRKVSDYGYWASHGGIPAMKKEIKKCEARCSFCHQLKTLQRYELRRQKEGRKVNVTQQRRQKQIDAIKLQIGKCKHCLREVTPEIFCAFDFDHLDEKNKIISISRFTKKSKKFYDEHLHQEIAKCQLLCRNCHHLKTHYPEDEDSP